MILAWTKDESGQHSILYDRKTTTLPLHLERLAVYGTAPLLGDYYRTYSGTWTSWEVINVRLVFLHLYISSQPILAAASAPLFSTVFEEPRTIPRRAVQLLVITQAICSACRQRWRIYLGSVAGRRTGFQRGSLGASSGCG